MYRNIYIIFINVNILLMRVWPDRIFICISFLNREKDEHAKIGNCETHNLSLLYMQIKQLLRRYYEAVGT